MYTWKNVRSVTAFNSTDIRSVQDNVATPVTAMMVTVCISTDVLSSVFISPDLSDTNSFHQCCWLVHHACYSLFLQTATVCSQHTCIILLHHTDTALTAQQTVPVWYRQFWTVCRRQQSDTVMISYLYQTWRLQQAVTGLWRFCVCKGRPRETLLDLEIKSTYYKTLIFANFTSWWLVA